MVLTLLLGLLGLATLGGCSGDGEAGLLIPGGPTSTPGSDTTPAAAVRQRPTPTVTPRISARSGARGHLLARLPGRAAGSAMV